MATKVFQASLLNVYAAATDVVVDSSTTPSTNRITGLMPIPVGSGISITEQAPTAEVQQVYTIGLAVPPVVTASTKYTIIIGNSANLREGANQNNMPYNYVSPAVLTGTAATDRFNMYHTLAQRINANHTNFMTAYNLITVTQSNSVAFAVGEIVTENASGATGINISGTTGTLTIAITSGTWTGASGTITGSIAGASTSATRTITGGIGLRLVDDSGYYPADGSRYGKNTVTLPTTSGWATPSTMLVLTTAAVYSFGQGARLLEDVPVVERTSSNLASGTWEMATNNAPISLATYQCFRITDHPRAFSGMPGEGEGAVDRLQVLWLQKTDAAGSPNADYAATRTALLALA